MYPYFWATCLFFPGHICVKTFVFLFHPCNFMLPVQVTFYLAFTESWITFLNEKTNTDEKIIWGNLSEVHSIVLVWNHWTGFCHLRGAKLCENAVFTLEYSFYFHGSMNTAIDHALRVSLSNPALHMRSIYLVANLPLSWHFLTKNSSSATLVGSVAFTIASWQSWYALLALFTYKRQVDCPPCSWASKRQRSTWDLFHSLE